MKIVVCYKSVPFDESIRIGKDRRLDLSEASWEVGKYDLNAVEAAVRLAGETGGVALALTANGEICSNSKLKKGILSRGPAEMFGVQDPSLAGADSYTLASVLKAAIEKLGDVDLVLCGEGSGDVYAQQVGVTLGALLGWTTLNAVAGIRYADGKLQVERNVSDGVELLSLWTPAVLCVTADINTPRVPTMKDIMGAGKKPATIWSLEDVGQPADSGCETLSVLAPAQMDRRRIILEGAGDEALDTLAGYIKKSI